MVGSEEEDALLGARDAVEGVQQAGEGDVGALVSVGVALRAAVAEGGVDVLEQHESALGDDSQQVIEPVVGQAAFAQVQDGDVVVQMAGEGLDEGALAAAGRAVQEVAAAVGDATVVVPSSAVEEIFDVVDDSFFDALV